MDRSIGRRALLAGLGALTSGCIGAGSPTPNDDATVTIGGSLPLSGPLQGIGVSLQRGLGTWAERMNASGGLLGREVNLRIVDDQGDAETARNAYRSLVETADFLVAPYGSPMTAAVIEVVESAGVPCLAHTAGRRRLWDRGREWTVQLLNPTDTFLHSLLAVASRRGGRSVAFVHRDDPFTTAVMAGGAEKAREQGWTTRRVVYSSERELEAKMGAVTKRRPDLLVGGGFRPGAAGGGFLPDALALSRAYEAADGDAALVCWSIGAAFPAYYDELGRSAERVTGITGWKPYVGYPGNRTFVRRYRDRWEESPDAHAAQGDASGQVLAAAVAAASSFDPGRVRDALFDLETATVFGRYRVDDRGLQVGKANAVVQWQSATPVVVWPDRWRSGTLVYRP